MKHNGPQQKNTKTKTRSEPRCSQRVRNSCFLCVAQPITHSQVVCRPSRDHMVIGFTSTCASSVYHH